MPCVQLCSRRPAGRLGRWALVLALAPVTVGCQDASQRPVALVGATIIDGTGAPPLRDGVVIVSGRTIVAAGPRATTEIPRNTIEVDLSGRWLIPGLIDLNVKLERWALERYVAHGVTAVRDLTTPVDSAAVLAGELNLNSVLGPRLFFSGGAIGTGVASAAQARREVDARAVADVHFIATGPELTAVMLRAAVDEAKAFLLPVSADLGMTDAVAAAEAGIASVELLSGVPQAALGLPGALQQDFRAGYQRGWIASAMSWSRLRPSSLDRVATQLAAQDVYLIPGLVLYYSYGNMDDPSLLPDDARVPAAVHSEWQASALLSGMGLTAADLRTIRQGRPAQDRFVGHFQREGGTVLAGTGVGRPLIVPGLSLHQELELLVQAGLAPQEAIRAATGGAAEFLAADSIGTIAPGRLADLVVLTADPLDQIANSRAIEQVMLKGQLIRPDSLASHW